MLYIRLATLSDLDFLIETDLLGDGYTFDPNEPPMTDEDKREHHEKIRAFVTLPSEAGWVVEDTDSGKLVGMILARFRDRDHEAPTEANRFLFRFLDEKLFPEDGRFSEVFQLWVHPDYRRKGLATQLKNALEAETRRRGMHMIYTHTEASNAHVIEMNHKLGYRSVRCGPLWDDIPRVSLVKWLD